MWDRRIGMFLGGFVIVLWFHTVNGVELIIRPVGERQFQPVGTEFKLTCEVINNDDNSFIYIAWYDPNYKVITRGLNKQIEVWEYENQLTLILKNPVSEQSGTYKCIARLSSKIQVLYASVDIHFYIPTTIDSNDLTISTEPTIDTAAIHGLRIGNFHVPYKVALGDSVWLNCSHDLQSNEFDSIKWYKDGIEFYRYIAKYNFPENFNRKGVYVHIYKSYEGHVYLYKTDWFSAGTYSCVVSAEAPSYQVVEKKSELFIYDPDATITSNDLSVSTEPTFVTTESELNELFEKAIKKLNFKLSENEHFGLSISRSLDKMPEEKASETRIKIMHILHAKRFKSSDKNHNIEKDNFEF